MGIVSTSAGVVRIAVDLQAHLEKIKNQTTRAFIEEAINCYEAGLHRSAIVMSWIAAVDTRADKILGVHFERATEILRQHRPACEKLVDALIAGLELSGQEVLDALDEDGHAEPRALRSC